MRPSRLQLRRQHRLAFRLALFGCMAIGAAQLRAELFFSAPYSGQKVTEYQVELPVSRHQRQSFTIPKQCPEAQAALRQGARQWCNRVDRNIWEKVRRDCDYVDFLQRFPARPSYDFVSNYDFMNARLSDLPINAACGGEEDSPNCGPLPPGVPDLSRILGRAETESDDPASGLQSCHITNGIFRGRVRFGSAGLDCEPDPLASGFRVIAIDYADVNGDGYQDVILRLIPLGRGMRRAPLTLPLTRKQPDGPFTIPSNLPGPVPRS